MRRMLIVILAAALFAPNAAGAGVLTVDRFVRMTRCSDPDISPDGETVAFVVSIPDLEANRNRTDIWLVPVRGGEPVRLTTSDGADYHPRWSPDGRSIAFVSTRGGAPQIYTIPVHGGEAVRLTDISTGAHDPVWSPDGAQIAFYSFVNPDCPDDSCNAARGKERDENPVKAKVIDHLLYRHWDTWKDGKRNHLFLVDVASGETVDLTAMEDHDYPPFPWGGSGDYAFSPDGREICCVAKVVDVEAISTNTDLFVIDIESRDIRRLTANEAADESPVYSPDGRFITYRAQERAGFESDRWRLMRHDRKDGETKELTAGFDRWVSEHCWAPDMKTIYFTAGDDGHRALFALDTGKGSIRKILATGHNASPRVTSDGKTIVLVRRSFDFPHSIWKISRKGKDLERLSAFNRDVLGGIELNPAESVRYEGAAGAMIQAFIIKPPGFDPGKKYPAIVLVHGGPQSAFIDSWYTNWNAQTFAAAGYVIFIPNFHGSDGFGQEFVDAITEDWGGKCYEDIMRGTDYLAALDYVDAKRIGAAGASYGGYMVNWIAGHTTRFACLVSMAGAFNLISKYGVTEELWFPEWDFGGTPYENPEGYERWSPHNFADRFTTPCLVVHGENDFRVPIGEGLQTFTALQRRGVPSKLVYFPDEGHWVLKPRNIVFYYEQFIEWMDSYLKP
jgi:dipeptidyl aminopeptidase/acylaminoacyl peptidase